MMSVVLKQLSTPLQKTIASLGFEQLTPIQKQAIPHLLAKMFRHYRQAQEKRVLCLCSYTPNPSSNNTISCTNNEHRQIAEAIQSFSQIKHIRCVTYMVVKIFIFN